MSKRILPIILLLSLLSGALAVQAENVTPQIHASIDDLPYLVQSRPDMSLPAPMKVTLTGTNIFFAPTSGKNEYKEPGIGQISTKAGGKAKWSSKQKAYFIDYVKAGIDISRLDDVVLRVMKEHKKDSKISKQLAMRVTVFTFRADTGSCESAAYAVLIKTKQGIEGHSLDHQASGHYLHLVNGVAVGLFDQAGLRIPTPPVTPPDSPDQLEGYQEMVTFPSVRYHWPLMPDSTFRVESDAAWDEVTITVQSLHYSHMEQLTFDEAEGGWLSKPLSELKVIQQAVKDHDLSAFITLSRKLDDGNTLRMVLPLDADYLASQGSPQPDGSLKKLQPLLTRDPSMQYIRKNAYGYTDLVATRTQDNLHVVLSDLIGNKQAEKDYPMPALDMQQIFGDHWPQNAAKRNQVTPGYAHEDFSNPEEVPLDKLKALSFEDALTLLNQPGVLLDISQISTHPITPPDWMPTIQMSETEWSVNGVPQNSYRISTMVDDGDGSSSGVYFDQSGIPVLRGENLEKTKKSFDGLLEFNQMIDGDEDRTVTHVFSTKDKVWKRSEYSHYVRRKEDYIVYSVSNNHDQLQYCMNVFSNIEIPGNIRWWFAHYNADGKLIPGSLEAVK